MKKIKNNIIAVFLVLTLFFIASVSIAQTPAPQAPPPPGHGTTGTTVPGGGAPIGEGLIFLIGLVAFYGSKKIYGLRKKLAE